LALYFVYAIAYILGTQVELNGISFPTLFDDAFVSMRYAKNFADGHGLVWNPGEAPVEGYTNLLWVLYMALLHAIGLSTDAVIYAVQVTSAVCLTASLAFLARIVLVQTNGSLWPAMAAVVCSALYLPLNTFSLQGMETGLLTLIFTAAIWAAVRATLEERFCRRIYVLVALALWVRPDAIVFGLTLVGYLVLFDPKRRRQHLIYGGLAVVGTWLALTAFRLGYYGERLPNTYYLKLTGYPLLLRLSRGAYVNLKFLGHANYLFILIPLGWGLVGKVRGARLISLLFLAQLAYSVWVGGDAWEEGGTNRYLCVVMPLFFALYWSNVWSALRSAKGFWSSGTLPRWGSAVLLGLGVVLTVLNFNSYKGSVSLSELALQRRPLLHDFHRQNVQLAAVVRGITTSEAKVLVVWAGAIPYLSDRHSYDMLGKCDKVIARSEAHLPDRGARKTGFWPGHNKWDYAYSIGELKPDVITRLWMISSAARPFLQGYQKVRVPQGTIYVKKGSPHIRWDKIGRAPQ